jgi:hypothetical protein
VNSSSLGFVATLIWLTVKRIRLRWIPKLLMRFLVLWSRADADVSFLVQARSELKALQTPAPTK